MTTNTRGSADEKAQRTHLWAVALSLEKFLKVHVAQHGCLPVVQPQKDPPSLDFAFGDGVWHRALRHEIGKIVIACKAGSSLLHDELACQFFAVVRRL